MQVRRALVPARSRYALATPFVSTAPHARSARSMSWPAARCRLRFRRSRSEASTIGTAVSSPIRRCNGCWTPRRERTRSPSKWICGAPAATFHAILSRARSARRISFSPAKPGWRRTSSRRCRSPPRDRQAAGQAAQGVAADSRGGDARGRGGRESLQRHPVELQEELRGKLQGLRVFPEDNGGALVVGLQRYGAHLAPPEGVATAQWPGRLLHL